MSGLIDLNIKGIYLAQKSTRYYPQQSLAAQLVGFLGGEGTGQYGLEEYYDDLLQGERLVYEGKIFSDFTASEKESRGSDIVLTIDYNIQFEAEKLLEAYKGKLHFEGGEIIVLEPSTGRVLALVNSPGFNPNYYRKHVKDLEIFQNGVTQKLFEPGSVFKPITMAAALDQEKLTPSTTYTDPGIIKVGGWPVYNYQKRIYPGEITMTEVLEKSINTGAVFIQKTLGNALFVKYLEKFGIFEPTGIDLKEVFSQNKEFKKGYDINYVTASFGQGIEITPIQLIRAYSAIANGGRLVTPYVVERIGYDYIEPMIKQEPVISQNTASQLAAMLVSVVENGFPKPAQIPGYYVGGKTGTAQIAWSALGISKTGYSDKTWQTFIGFAPAFNARFLILVKLDNPQTKTAEYSAVPLFQELANYIINYYQIPPDY